MKHILAFDAVSAVLSGSDSGPVLWSEESLKHIDQNLVSKLNEKKLAAERLGQFDNHLVALVRREGSGDAEQHVKTADISQVVSGAVFHIPANAPHQVLVQSGKQFVYVMVKVEKP